MVTSSENFKPWTKDELEMLKQLCESGKNIYNIAKQLHRSYYATLRKASDHNFPRKHSWLEMGELAEQEADDFLQKQGFSEIKRMNNNIYGKNMADYEAVKNGNRYGIGVTYSDSTYIGIRRSSLERLVAKYSHVVFVIKTTKCWYLMEAKA